MAPAEAASSHNLNARAPFAHGQRAHQRLWLRWSAPGWSGMVGPRIPTRAAARTVEKLERAKGGNQDALESLAMRHQSWNYDIAIRVLYWPTDAEDATPEILIKVVTKLTSLKGRSTFRASRARRTASSKSAANRLVCEMAARIDHRIASLTGLCALPCRR